MAGYWQRPDETAAVMTDDGFFRTGDIGMMDEDGSFRIVDRKKDMINVSGFNVYPSEIEDVVLAMPGMVEAAVVGIPNEASGEAVKLFVVRSDDAVDESAVRAFCRPNYRLQAPARDRLLRRTAEERRRQGAPPRPAGLRRGGPGRGVRLDRKAHAFGRDEWRSARIAVCGRQWSEAHQPETQGSSR